MAGVARVMDGGKGSIKSHKKLKSPIRLRNKRNMKSPKALQAKADRAARYAESKRSFGGDDY